MNVENNLISGTDDNKYIINNNNNNNNKVIGYRKLLINIILQLSIIVHY